MSLLEMLSRTEQELVTYLQTFWFPGASSADIQTVLDHYPSDPAAGSPFGTGDEYAYTPEYKRMAAFQGDLIEIGPRRLFTRFLSDKQPVYAYRTS